MNGEEHEDLLVHVSEAECSSEESEAYLDTSSRIIAYPSQDNPSNRIRYCYRKRAEFICTGILCLLSATSLLVLLPLYLDSANRVADVYSVLLFVTFVITVLIFLLACLSAKLGLSSTKSLKKVLKPPFRLWKLAQAGFVNGMGGLCVIYALDRQRVLCHLQDPMKAVILVFSLIYYFCFSKKIMGLQKIFCATTVIIGLFVSVDYSLCDEFRCRGYEREHVQDDTGHWSKLVHFLWSLAYINGLALWSMHFSLLEGNIVALKLPNLLACSSRTSLLETISCMVSTQQANINSADHWEDEAENHQPLLPNAETSTDHNKRLASNVDKITSPSENDVERLPHSTQSTSPSTFAISLWVYFFSFVMVLISFGTGLAPSIGKNSSFLELVTSAKNCVICHFHSIGNEEKLNFPNSTTTDACGLLPVYGWLFILCLLIFSLSAYHFLLLSQSSVFTVALITAALPVGNIFWSMFRLVPIDGGAIQWWPNITAELVCSLLGIPIIATGLVLLCKMHWLNTGTQREVCCTLRYHNRSVNT